MSINYVIRIDPGYDTRDEPGGIVHPLMIVFDVVGPRLRVSWGINTGWVQRPVLSKALADGPQFRTNVPGVDPHLTSAFPEPLLVSLVPHAGEGELRDATATDYEHYLLQALFTGGQDAVFSILRTIHDVSVA